MPNDVILDSLETHAFEIPSDGPDGVEADGTLSWDSATMILVIAKGGGHEGIGYTYADVSTAAFVDSKLASVVVGGPALSPPKQWQAMSAAIRNAGRPGVGSMAVSAVDIALWDLRAHLLGLPLADTLPRYHDRVPVYGSGGFTNYPLDRLCDQLGGWAEQGIPRVKLKVSRHPEEDPRRLDAVRKAVGSDVEVFVDSNGALNRKQALYWARRFAEQWDVRWYEEPVTSDDPEGLRMLREEGPGRMDIAAGEYGFIMRDFTDLLRAEAVDCLQADVTRCGGITGVLQVSGLASGFVTDLSAHCAPAVSAHAFCAVERLRHLEYFHPHVRIESMLFDGTLEPEGGALRPDPARTGLGLRVKWEDAEPYRVHGPGGSRG
jgi:L-alanine-DL-glutamate epimerase-like enolase superfamily enzyme